MSTWICLLRGVNLGARNKLNMSALRDALAEAGLANVRTYLQSGNVVVDSAADAPDEIASVVGEVLGRRFDLNVPVIMRSPHQLQQLATRCPFREQARAGAVVHLLFLTTRPAVDRVAALTEQDWTPDAIVIDGLDAAIAYATSMHKSRLQHSTVLRRLGVDGTARNWRTVQALVEMTTGLPEGKTTTL